jgi:GTP cyclohydrolase I
MMMVGKSLEEAWKKVMQWLGSDRETRDVTSRVRRVLTGSPDNLNSGLNASQKHATIKSARN